MASFCIEIAGERVDAERYLLQPRELCFPLQRTLEQIRKAIRSGDLPRAGRGRVDAEALCRQLVAEDDLLAVEYVRGWAEARFELPQPAALKERPPHLEERLDLLRRGQSTVRQPVIGTEER